MCRVQGEVHHFHFLLPCTLLAWRVFKWVKKSASKIKSLRENFHSDDDWRWDRKRDSTECMMKKKLVMTININLIVSSNFRTETKNAISIIALINCRAVNEETSRPISSSQQRASLQFHTFSFDFHSNFQSRGWGEQRQRLKETNMENIFSLK